MALHPDGLTLVPRKTTIRAGNASRYGYRADIKEAMTMPFVEALTDHDLSDWGKMDLSYGCNAEHKDETLERLIPNWCVHKKLEFSDYQKQLQAVASHSRSSTPKYRSPPNANAPKVNVYLRPAVRNDAAQLVDIYNWYIENTPRAVELGALAPVDFVNRYDVSVSGKLPFIVAVQRSVRTNRTMGGREIEKIVGFSSATDLAAPHFSERISAELEVYVHREWLRKGVGRCLLDKLLESTDRGHLARGGYAFTCDPAIRHYYEAGGGRDLHKLVFVIRHFQNPKKLEENDLDVWLKKWLTERWGFEESACLKGIGAKFGRL